MKFKRLTCSKSIIIRLHWHIVLVMILSSAKLLRDEKREIEIAKVQEENYNEDEKKEELSNAFNIRLREKLVVLLLLNSIKDDGV
jgi:hypothetical protein